MPARDIGAGPRFHWLGISDVRRETSDAISVAFDVPEPLAARYAFHAGQYLTLRAEIDGEEVRRSYSICSGEADGELRIAIKRVDDGIFSAWAFDALKRGRNIEVMTPTGRFGIPSGGGSRVHVGFAAGSGITPVISMIRTVLAREPASCFFLFYGSRSTGEILFRGALEDLKDRFMGRLSVLHVLSRERQDVDALNGRIDRDKLVPLTRAMLGGTDIDAAYVCGPSGMIEDVETALLDVGVAAEKIQVERFTSTFGGRPRPPAVIRPQAAPFAIATLTIDGARTKIPVAEHEPVLDAALRAGLNVPFACRGGMCSTCRARVLQGEVSMAVNYSLEPWELAAGFVLTCQARPVSRRVEIDYDQQ